jgi:branched-subunit amino acid transport protein
VLGGLVAWLLRMFAFLLRLVGNLGFYAGRFVVNVYDLIIFPAIWLEGIFRGSKSKKMELPDVEVPEDSPLAEEAVGGFEETIKLKEQQE